ncbi:MAG TPA: hypothetical protein VK841_01545 [Polyangiaceae bacterium]|nr:hypothetical protein [Polyangiaceae bacterium]
MLRPLATFAAALVTLHASRAYATPSARLVYSRTADAASCPDEGALRTAVAARVGYDPFFGWAKRTVIANLAREDGAYVAKIDLVDEQGLDHGARALRTEGPCADLLDTVALAIAIAIDPQSLTRAESTPNPVPEPDARPPAAAREAPTPPPAAPSPADSGPARSEAGSSGAPSAQRPVDRRDGADENGAPAVEAFLGAVVSDGVAPGPAPGVALGSALLWKWVSLGVDARIDAASGETAPTGDGSVSSWLVVGTLAPCARFGPLRVPLLACALIQAGSMQSGGSGVSERKTGSALWFATGGRLGVGIRLSAALELRARGDLVVDLARTSLLLDGAGVWRADPVAGSLALDGVVHFR